jgi:very-short-patch-repair endonuclease
LRRNGLPRPRLNVWLEVGGETIQVDRLWPAGIVVELDGFAGHGTRLAFREDRARDRRLRVAGYGVTRLAPEQLDEEPDEIAADLRMLLNGGDDHTRTAEYKRP